MLVLLGPFFNLRSWYQNYIPQFSTFTNVLLTNLQYLHILDSQMIHLAPLILGDCIPSLDQQLQYNVVFPPIWET